MDKILFAVIQITGNVECEILHLKVVRGSAWSEKKDRLRA